MGYIYIFIHRYTQLISLITFEIHHNYDNFGGEALTEKLRNIAQFSLRGFMEEFTIVHGFLNYNLELGALPCTLGTPGTPGTPGDRGVVIHPCS